MFIFLQEYHGPELTLEDEDLVDTSFYEEERKSFTYKFKNDYKEPLGKEGLRKKIMEILGEEN